MVALVGRANVGKSSLLNALLEEKISIVSPVCQTTRNLIRGVLTEERGQLVLLDTPGVHRAPGELGKRMNGMARAAVEGVDGVLLLVDASREPLMEDAGWIRRLSRAEMPVLLAFNKCDLALRHREEFERLWREENEAAGVAAPRGTMDVSAVRGDGLSTLLDALFAWLPEGPPLFPADVLTDFPRKIAVADVIREKYFLRLHDELPHSLAVKVDDIAEDEQGAWQVKATIYVERFSQKGILIGQKGRLLRTVKRESVRDLSQTYGVPVTVELWIKVEKNWDRNFWMLKQLGYA